MNLRLRKNLICAMMCGALFGGITSCKSKGDEQQMAYIDTEIERINIFEENHLRLIGRCNNEKIENKDSIGFHWSATGFEFVVETLETTNTISAKFYSRFEGHATQYIKVYVDGAIDKVIELKEGEETVELTNNLKAGKHIVKVLKMNEISTTRLNLLDISGTGIKYFARKHNEVRNYIEFYGDSITAGYGNLGTPESKTYLTKEQDATLTYAQQVADKLNYDASNISWSGIALAAKLAPYGVDIMDKYDTVDGKNKFEMNKIKPRIVVMNLGSNDSEGYNLETMTTQSRKEGIEEFIKNYEIIMDTIKKNSPDCKIISCYNMCFPITTKLVSAIKASTIKINEKYGEGTAFSLQFQNNQSGANGHPSLTAHNVAADVLYKFIEDNGLSEVQHEKK